MGCKTTADWSILTDERHICWRQKSLDHVDVTPTWKKRLICNSPYVRDWNSYVMFLLWILP